MKLIVGLGNPGSQYAETRHNIGFKVIELLATRNGITLNRKRMRAVYGKGIISGQPVLLAMPQTFMNESGDAVMRLAQFYKVTSAADILGVYDDISLELGTLRVRRSGSDGGHKGLRSIITRVGGGSAEEHNHAQDVMLGRGGRQHGVAAAAAQGALEVIPRVRLGVGAPPAGVDAVGYVLSSFKASERKPVAELIEYAAEAVEYYLAHGIDDTMNRFNG